MISDKQYDLAVIGGGPGGYVAAIRASQLGLRVALIEREEVGGVCLNWGCIPSKALLRTAEIIELFKRSTEFGISVDNLRYDFGGAVARSRGIVNQLIGGVQYLLKKNGVRYFKGTGKLMDPNTITVEGGNDSQTITAVNIILATGSRVKPLPGLEPDGDRIITSKEALALPAVPSSIVIVGGGPTGVEFAYLYRAYGSDVTVVEVMQHLLPNEDEDIGNHLMRSFNHQGIDVLTDHVVKSVEHFPSNSKVSLESGEFKREIYCEKILVAVGVQANSDGLGLEEVGIQLERGFIKTEGNMRTNVSHIYAIGDVTGKMLLAHVAQAQAVTAVEVIAGLESQILDYGKMPRAIYCQPQVTSFGYSEREATEMGYRVKVGRFPFNANGKALALGETDGFVKLVVNADDGEVLGAHMIGSEVTEMLMGLTITNLLGGNVGDIASLVQSHPTLAEVIKEAALAVDGIAIHI